MSTAETIGGGEPDARWREFNVGNWEGLTSDEVRVRFPGQLEALMAGEDLQFGGGEWLGAFRERIIDAYWELADSLDDGEEAAVVTHGGVVWAILNHLLGLEGRPSYLVPLSNTSVTRTDISDGQAQVTVFNDASHLTGSGTAFAPNGTSVVLFRHGQTEGNTLGRYQGRTDSALTDRGRDQVAAAAGHAPRIGQLYSSPLGRAHQSAGILGKTLGMTPEVHEGLAEMDFGAWENLTSGEIADIDPELFDNVFGKGVDLPRGGRGETFSSVAQRMRETIEEIAATANGSAVGAVTHGAAIRACAVGILDLGFPERHRLPVPRNSSMSKFLVTPKGPMVAEYNVAPHLD